MDTSVKQMLGSVPLVSVLKKFGCSLLFKEFDCSLYYQGVGYSGVSSRPEFAVWEI